jgi:hypothetical protein
MQKMTAVEVGFEVMSTQEVDVVGGGGYANVQQGNSNGGYANVQQGNNNGGYANVQQGNNNGGYANVQQQKNQWGNWGVNV